jgi:preprotein translocase subunit SecY
LLTSLRNIFKVPDLRNKVLFTLLMLGLYRLGAHVPVPGVDYQAIQSLQDSAKAGGALGFLNLFSGGALTSFAVFALGIMPYITASIIIQILGVVIPKLEEWQDQGAVGQRKITQWTRYVSMAIALLQGTALTFLLGKGGTNVFTGQSFAIPLLPDFALWRVLMVVGTVTVGTAIVMWFGEVITQRGIGNGMSLIIMASVVSRLPFDGEAVRKEGGNFIFGILVLLSIVTLVGIVFVEMGQRRIPVQFAKRVVGRRMYGGQSTYIPLKVNQSGVIPIIFAASVLYLPTIVSNVSNWQGLQDWVDHWLLRTTSPLYIVVYGLLILGFAYFYTAISFDPAKQADQIRRQGGFIPGIRPGPQTERYLAKILNRVTLPGALFVVFIAVLPSIILAIANINRFFFGGTTVLIAVGVALETMKQIDSQLMMRNYEGFLK